MKARPFLYISPGIFIGTILKTINILFFTIKKYLILQKSYDKITDVFTMRGKTIFRNICFGEDFHNYAEKAERYEGYAHRCCL